MVVKPPHITTSQIADSLRADILSGNLKSNRPLRQDEIASRFHVSKIPVREALVQLKAEGLVTFYPNRGAFVSELTAAEADEIYVMRIALETALLKRSIPHLTVSQLQHAQDMINAIDTEKNIAKWGELNWEFHITLYAPAPLPRIKETIRNLHAGIARYLVLYLAGLDYQKVSQNEHRELLDACRHGNVELAVIILETHLRSASDQLVAYLSGKKSIQPKKEKKK
jgi:DNA-binding GntR family transcriptional regulator